MFLEFTIDSVFYQEVVGHYFTERLRFFSPTQEED